VTQLRQKMLEELQRRNYSHRTAKTYVRIVREFAEHFHQPPDKLGPEQIRQYQAHLFQAKKLAPATVSQYVSALRFFFVKTLRRHFLAEYIPFPKSRRRLPTVLSPDEVTRLIDAACNLYHRTLLMTLYSTAVRRAELCRLKVQDIDSQRMMIRINQGKGGRDREVPLSPKLLQTLRVYFRWMRPTTFLFPGTVKGVRADLPITPNVVWLACRQAAQRAGFCGWVLYDPPQRNYHRTHLPRGDRQQNPGGCETHSSAQAKGQAALMLSPVEELRMPSDEWIKALADGRRVKFTYQELPDEGMRGRSSPLRLKVTQWSIRSY
jgi:integrase/recombinase XerD